MLFDEPFALTLPTDSAVRKDIPVMRGCIHYFPAALAGVAHHSKLGNDKHNPGEPLHHARGKSMDHADCQLRHQMDMADMLAWIERHGPGPDIVAMLLDEANANCWRALAQSQELWEKYGGAPLAPGARLDAPAPSADQAPLPSHFPLFDPEQPAGDRPLAPTGSLELPCGCMKRCKGHAAKTPVDLPKTGPKDPSGRPYATEGRGTGCGAMELEPVIADRKEFDPAD